MATKWAVNQAVKQSSLPPPGRLIMFVLSDIADPKSGIIPDDRTPALRELAKWTGLAKSTVIRHLDALDDDGWIHRDRPDRHIARRDHVRTRYRIDVGRGAQEDMPRGAEEDTGLGAQEDTEENTPVVHPAPSQDGNSGQDATSETPPRGAQEDMPRGAEEDSSLYRRSSNDKTPSSSAKPPKANPDPPPDRPDVDKICNHLADRLIANGCRPPTITKRWRTEARLLLDKDGKTVDQVIRCIDWATTDPFWKANILSMPTLRAKYDQLRLAAQRATSRASPRRPELVEHNGLMLKPETVAQLERSERFAEMDRQQEAIEGTR